MIRFIEVMKLNDIAPGGMKAVKIGGYEIVLCNSEGNIHALQRRCGHMNSPLEKGTLDGMILTCAMHCAQFEISSGEVLCGPVPRYSGEDSLPPAISKYLNDIGKLMQDIHTNSVKTFTTFVENGLVMLDIEQLGSV